MFARRRGQPEGRAWVMPFSALALTVAGYGLAMAYVEAAVVVDLNGALDQQVGALFPLPPAMTVGPLVLIEAGREAATLVMLVAVGIMAGRSAFERLSWSAVAFGTWDIGYYAWLNVFTGWPPSLGAWDVLLLIPVPWTGPVWAPVAVSVALVGFGLLVARRLRAGGTVTVTPWHVAAGIGGGLLVILSFTLDAPRIMAGGVPEAYAWPLLLAGLALAAGAVLDSLRVPGRPILAPRLP